MFDFPNNPSDGERVVHPNGNTYEYQTIRNSWVIAQDDLAHPDITSKINSKINSFYYLNNGFFKTFPLLPLLLVSVMMDLVYVADTADGGTTYASKKVN